MTSQFRGGRLGGSSTQVPWHYYAYNVPMNKTYALHLSCCSPDPTIPETGLEGSPDMAQGAGLTIKHSNEACDSACLHLIPFQ